MASITAERRQPDLSPLVTSVLQTGPFHLALQTCIHENGLTLERLEYHLLQRGFRIGRSTLSYWQHGRRRPERPNSLQALSALEEILGVPRASLSSLLGAPKPRGRWLNHNADGLSWSDMYADREDVMRLVAIDNRQVGERLQDVAVQEKIYIGADRRMQWLESRKLSQARSDDADRNLLVYTADPDVDVSRIKLTNLENCRIGRQRVLTESRFVAFEVIFDRVLRERETHMFSYRMDISEAFLSDAELSAANLKRAEATQGLRGFRRPVHSYVLGVNFDPTMIPVRCYHVEAPWVGGPQQISGELNVSGSGSAHVGVQNVQAGMHGMRWEWE